MSTALIISLSLTVLLGVLSILFKVAGKLRLSLPLLYLLVASGSTFFTDWTSNNEPLVLMGLYILLGLVALSWVYSLVKAIKHKVDERAYEKAVMEDMIWQRQKAQELGIDLNTVVYDSQGNMRDKMTGEHINFRKN